jgi:hypothetical protein
MWKAGRQEESGLADRYLILLVSISSALARSMSEFIANAGSSVALASSR